MCTFEGARTAAITLGPGRLTDTDEATASITGATAVASAVGAGMWCACPLTALAHTSGVITATLTAGACATAITRRLIAAASNGFDDRAIRARADLIAEASSVFREGNR